MTVSGLTMTSTLVQLGQSRDSHAQNTRSLRRNLGRFTERERMASCWRSAKFSAASEARLRTRTPSNVAIPFRASIPFLLLDPGNAHSTAQPRRNGLVVTRCGRMTTKFSVGTTPLQSAQKSKDFLASLTKRSTFTRITNYCLDQRRLGREIEQARTGRTKLGTRPAPWPPVWECKRAFAGYREKGNTICPPEPTQL